MKIAYALEPFSDALLCEFLPLLKEHYAELWKHRDIPLSPDFQRYYAMSQAGMLHIVTARSEGKLIGYCVSMLMKGLHYSGAGFASVDIVYLDREYRKGLVAYRMLEFMESDLKGKGITFIQHHVKPEPDFSPLLSRMGFEDFEKIMMKRIN